MTAALLLVSACQAQPVVPTMTTVTVAATTVALKRQLMLRQAWSLWER